MWRLPFRRIRFNFDLYSALVSLEPQTAHFRVVGSRDLRVHSSRRTSQRFPLARVPRRAVLYIGADHECRIVLSRIVRRLENTDLVVADDGRQGRLFAVSRTPNLILLDAQLSDCDAHDLMAYLGRAALRARVPLAIVSADETERMRFIRAGAVAWMTKPLKIAEVERSMIGLLDLFSHP